LKGFGQTYDPNEGIVENNNNNNIEDSPAFNTGDRTLMNNTPLVSSGDDLGF